MENNFWEDNVSNSHGKHNISSEAWDRICKMRNSPIRLLEDYVIGDYHRPHTVLPKGLKGYLIDFPEAFFLTEDDLETISAFPNYVPASFSGYGEVVLLRDEDYEIIPPFFDMFIADYAFSNSDGD